jgi:hypothetical protein
MPFTKRRKAIQKEGVAVSVCSEMHNAVFDMKRPPGKNPEGLILQSQALSSSDRHNQPGILIFI